MAIYQIWVNQPFMKAGWRAELQDRVRAIRLEAGVVGDARAEAGSGGGCVWMMQQERGCSTAAGAAWMSPMLFYFPQVQPKRSHSSFPSVILMHLNCRIPPQPYISHASLHHIHPYLNLFVHYTPN